MNASMKEHWDEIYEALDVDELTWYEEISEMAKARKISCPAR